MNTYCRVHWSSNDFGNGGGRGLMMCERMKEKKEPTGIAHALSLNHHHGSKIHESRVCPFWIVVFLVFRPCPLAAHLLWLFHLSLLSPCFFLCGCVMATIMATTGLPFVMSSFFQFSSQPSLTEGTRVHLGNKFDDGPYLSTTGKLRESWQGVRVVPRSISRRTKSRAPKNENPHKRKHLWNKHTR